MFQRKSIKQRNPLLAFLLSVLFFSFFSLQVEQVFSVGEGDLLKEEGLYVEQKLPEARAWLEAFEGEGAPAVSLRFGSVEKALRLVRRLYRAGALCVAVIEVLGEPQGFRVDLPDDYEKRRRLFKVANAELRASGYALEKDRGQSTLAVWWRRPVASED